MRNRQALTRGCKPGQSLNAAFEKSKKGLGNTKIRPALQELQLQRITISASAVVARKHNIMCLGYYNEDGILRYADTDTPYSAENANIASEIHQSGMKVKFNAKYMHSDNRLVYSGNGLDGGLSEGFYHSLARFRPTAFPVDLMDISPNCL